MHSPLSILATLVSFQRKSASNLSQNWKHIFKTLNLVNWQSSNVSFTLHELCFFNFCIKIFFSNLYEDADPSNAGLVGPGRQGRFRIKPAQISSPPLRFPMLLRRQFAARRIFEKRPQILASAVWVGGHGHI